MTLPEQSSAPPDVRASQLLKVRAVWILPIALTSILVFLMTLIYFGSFVDPPAHLRGLPVLIVNQDRGDTIGGKHLDIGQQVATTLTHTPEVTSRLSLATVSLAKAQADMNVGADYATVVIPSTFTRSLVGLSGLQPLAPGTPARAAIELLTNQRLGSIGSALATGVVQPAVSTVSNHVGQMLLPLSTAANRANPIIHAQIADPITLATIIERPLPQNSALGLSAFYVSLLALMCGFLGAVIVNSSIDAALGYASSEIGPKLRQRVPVSISRWQTLLAKWGMSIVVVPLLAGLLLVVAVGILGMDAPNLGVLWLFISFAAVMVGVGTLTLFAALGTLGQLIGILLFVYLGLASSGGTVPLQAVPGVFGFFGRIEPLRQVVDGVRAILYFGAEGQAGLTHALTVIGLELIFWIIVGTAVTTWYDRRGLYRLAPDLLAYVTRSAREYHAPEHTQPSMVPEGGSKS